MEKVEVLEDGEIDETFQTEIEFPRWNFLKAGGTKTERYVSGAQNSTSSLLFLIYLGLDGS